MANIGLGFCGAYRLDEAIPYLIESVELMVNGTGATNNRAWARTNLAVALERANRLKEVIPVLEALVEDHKETGDADAASETEKWSRD